MISPNDRSLRRRRETRVRRRCTTATVAAPATKPVAASAAAWPAGTQRPCGLDVRESATTGRPSTISPSVFLELTHGSTA